MTDPSYICGSTKNHVNEFSIRFVVRPSVRIRILAVRNYSQNQKMTVSVTGGQLYQVVNWTAIITTMTIIVTTKLRPAAFSVRSISPERNYLNFDSFLNFIYFNCDRDSRFKGLQPRPQLHIGWPKLVVNRTRRAVSLLEILLKWQFKDGGAKSDKFSVLIPP